MSARFDPDVLWRTLPSFYRERLGTEDRELIASLWEGVLRIADLDYARAVQLAATPRVGEASALLRQAWVYQEFAASGWTIRHTRHRHAIVRRPGDVSGTFYLGRSFAPTTLRVWYDGLRIDTAAPTIVSNVPDGAQLSGAQAHGTRIEFRRVGGGGLEPDPSYFDATKELTVEGEETHDRLLTLAGASRYEFQWWNGTADEAAAVDDATLTAEIPWLAGDALGVTIDDVAVERPTLTWPDGFRVGQAFDVLRTDGTMRREVVDVAGPTYRLKLTKTESGGANVEAVLWACGLRLWPDPVVVAADRLVFPQPLPPGTRVRVTDPGGTQSFTVERAAAVLTLTRPVDPTTAAVYVHNVDLLHVTVDRDAIDFGRPPRDGAYVRVTARYRHEHDHARYAEVVTSPTDVVTIPATRPLALRANLTEDPCYPVRVYVDGRLLESTYYSFDSTIAVRFTQDVQIGQRVDVVYTDAETLEEHAHVRGELETGVALSALTLPEPTEPSRYPTLVERRVGTLFPAANATTAVDGVTIRLSPSSEGKFYFEGAVRGRNFRYLVPGRGDESASWRGTLVAAESLQDGIDAPDVLLTGDDLRMTRTGDDVLIETAERLTAGWFKNAQLDEHTLSDVLGEPIGYVDRGESTERYRRLLLALYAAFVQGSQAATLENFGCLVLGSDYAPRAGADLGTLRRDDQVRVRRIEAADGTVDEAVLSDLIADRATPTLVSALHAVSAHCRVYDRGLADVRWLAFFAEALSADYRYAKRIDVRRPAELASTPDSYDATAFVLEDRKVDFREAQVWKNDLIWLRTTGVSTPQGAVASVDVYARVEEVLDAHRLRVRLTLEDVSLGWGEPEGWGEAVGWGGLVAVDGIESYRIWTRTSRRVDEHLFLDELRPDALALADGESVERINVRLAALLRHTWFGVRIAWEAQRDRAALDDLKFFLDRAKPAEVGYCAWTQVRDDEGIVDVCTTELRDRDVTVELPLRHTYIGLDYIGSMFTAPTVETVDVDVVEFDRNWWITSGTVTSGYIGTNTAVGSTVLSFFL